MEMIIVIDVLKILDSVYIICIQCCIYYIISHKFSGKNLYKDKEESKIAWDVLEWNIIKQNT